MILLLDNFDSFTFNLQDYLLQCGAKVKVIRNNEALSAITNEEFSGVIISPGPGKCEEAGNTLSVIDYYKDKVPILGICLGHQAVGHFFGARITRARRPMHGKISEVKVEDDILFAHLPERIKVTRYHSLILDNITPELECIASTDEGEVMAIRHKRLPIRGIQFHPEAELTQYGLKIISNWIINYALRD